MEDDGESPSPAEAVPQPGRRSLAAWQDELNATPGFHATTLMMYVRRVAYVLQGNVAEYKTLVARLHEPMFAATVFNVFEPQSHDDLLSEAERLLHNVLMALSTRIDQLRAFMNRNFSDDAELMAEYQSRVTSSFGTYAPGDFLRDLRNYLTHHRLPVAQSRQQFSSDSFSATFLLLRQPLLRWSRWTAASRSWLESQDDEIEIVDLVDGYARIAGTFDKWLHDRIASRYAVEIRAYETEAQEFNREYDRMFGS